MARLAPPRRRPTARSERGLRGGERGPMPLRGAAGPFGVPVQPKLAIGPARDRFEAEADRAADHVMSSAPGVPAITPLAPAPAMRMAEPENEAVQRAVKDESEEVQRQVEDEDGQAELLQPKSDGGGSAPAASSSVEAGIHAARGSGSPLPAATRGRMEQGFGRDFSAVRVHDDSRAARLNEGVNARAFTTGSDIFFSRGAYAPGTSSGDRLLAHELAHVAQQSGPGQLQPKRIQRDGNPPADDSQGPVFEDGARRIDTRNRPWVFTVPELRVPRIDTYVKGVTPGPGRGGLLPASGSFRWTGKGSRTIREEDGAERETPQVQVWEQGVRDAPGLRSAIESKVRNVDYDIKRQSDNEPIYYLKHIGRTRDTRESRDTGRFRDNFTLIGTIDQLTRNHVLLRPPFSRTGLGGSVDVDHYKEIQLGGEHRMSNLWLLESRANSTSGDRIKHDAISTVEALVDKAEEEGFWEARDLQKPSFRSGSKRAWPDPAQIQFIFNRVSDYDLPGWGWTEEDITSGRHLRQIRSYTQAELITQGILLPTVNGQPVAPGMLTVFSSSATSFRKTLRVRNDELRRVMGNSFIDGYRYLSGSFSGNLTPTAGDEIGRLTGTPFVDDSEKRRGKGITKGMRIEAQETQIPILATETPDYSGYLDKRELRAALSRIRAYMNGASPVTVDDVDINENFQIAAAAHVDSDAALFKDFSFDIRIVGSEVFIDVPVPAEKLSFWPFEVTEASIQLGYGENGLFFAGTAGFRINGVGEGQLEARDRTLSGTFDFDIDAFDPADLAVTYADGVWSGSATLGIKPGTIPFIEQGTINTGLNEQGNFFLVGTAILAGTGIPAGTELNISYNQETGEFSFGGDVPLDTSRLPGLTNARVGFTVTRTEAGDYRVDGTGSAMFSKSGISGRVAIDYINGLITANGEAVVNRPPLTGSANFHLSNQAVGDDGQPIEGPPLDTFRAWGGGTASIQFGRYITGTAGIQFLENGEIELMGQIALPPTITLIEATRYHYDIFTFPEVRFPIIGFTIPVINRSFGVFGFISGGLDANLTLGPGELVDSQVTVTYNPDRPEDMAITGGSTFQIGASADVGLRVSGGIGAGLAIVEATGEVGLRGALGLELSGGASVLLNWTPTDGLSIDASVFGEAQPTFSISVVADARVVVDAVLWSGTLWNESWERELASIGPDMRWRAELPARWSEQDGLEADINNLELTYPDIDLRGLAVDVFEAIV